MNAVRYYNYGGSDVLVYEDADRPDIGRNEVLVQVAGTSFNEVDAAIRVGVLQDVIPLQFPHIPGIDVAGVITEVGADVIGWETGDPVLALLSPAGPGAAADYVAVPAEELAVAPLTVDLADAAALPLVGLTASQSLFEHADLQPGQNILINGAGSSVGGYAVQLAVRAGTTVTATASPRSRERTRTYGAEHIIDYTTTSVEAAVAGRQFDVVLNLVPTDPEETERLVDLVADGGTFVSITSPAPPDVGRDVRTVHAMVHSDTDDLAELVAHVDRGQLEIDVAERLPLAELSTVHARATARLAEVTDQVARSWDGPRRTRAIEVADMLAADARTVTRELAGKTVLVP